MRNGLNSLTTKKQTRANSLDLDEVAHYELPHQNLRCLQIQLFSCLVLTELIERNFRQRNTKSAVKYSTTSMARTPLGP